MLHHMNEPRMIMMNQLSLNQTYQSNHYATNTSTSSSSSPLVSPVSPSSSSTSYFNSYNIGQPLPPLPSMHEHPCSSPISPSISPSLMNDDLSSLPENANEFQVYYHPNSSCSTVIPSSPTDSISPLQHQHHHHPHQYQNKIIHPMFDYNHHYHSSSPPSPIVRHDSISSTSSTVSSASSSSLSSNNYHHHHHHHHHHQQHQELIDPTNQFIFKDDTIESLTGMPPAYQHYLKQYQQKLKSLNHQKKDQQQPQSQSCSSVDLNADRPYSCMACQKSFARKHDLQRHTRVHTGVKPYICLCCKKAFARTDALKRHLRMEDVCRFSPDIQRLKNTGKRRYRNL